MKNFVQPGDIITVTAPYDRTSGQGVKVGSLFGVACFDALSGAELEIKTNGVFDITKLSTDTPSQGTPMYWDDTNKRLTTTSTSNTLVGAAVKAAGSGEATVRIRLNGHA